MHSPEYKLVSIMYVECKFPRLLFAALMVAMMVSAAVMMVSVAVDAEMVVI